MSMDKGSGYTPAGSAPAVNGSGYTTAGSAPAVNGSGYTTVGSTPAVNGSGYTTAGGSPANSAPVEEHYDIDYLEVTGRNGTLYRLSNLRKIESQGKMGTAYRATLLLPKGTSRQVFFKLCERKQGASEKDYKNACHLFVNESELVCHRYGVNVIRGEDYGTYEGKPFLITEFYDGENLGKKIERREYIGKEREALKIISGIIDGLIQLEKSQVTHRDIKPQNIIILYGDFPVIIDLGLSSKPTYKDLKMKSVGTPGYGAPEQLNSGKATFASDIYSVGIIFLEMLQGTKKPDDIKVWPQNNIYRFIQKCCQKNPADRFPSASVAKDKIQEILVGFYNPREMNRTFEEAVARRFCDDGMISDTEKSALMSLAVQLGLSTDFAEENIGILVKEIREFREISLVGNILEGRPDNTELDDIAVKIHIPQQYPIRWKSELVSAMGKYAEALRNSDTASQQEILEQNPYFRGREADIRRKFSVRRPTLTNKPGVQNTAPAKQAGTAGWKRLAGIGIAVAVVIALIALYPKGDASKAPVAPSVAQKEAAQVMPEKQPEATPVQEQKTFEKPATFDEKTEAFDQRDGRTYKQLNYLGKVWLVGNMNYSGKELSFASCYEKAQSCDEFGRLYDYESAMRACPAGFRLPSHKEWKLVLDKVGEKGADKLRNYKGFAALNAGYYQKAFDAYFFKGELAGWWVGDSEENGKAEVFNIFRNDPMRFSKEIVNDGYSVRCIKE